MSIIKLYFRVIVPMLVTLVLFSLVGCGSVSKQPNSGDGSKSSPVKLKIGYPVGSLTKELFRQMKATEKPGSIFSRILMKGLRQRHK